MMNRYKYDTGGDGHNQKCGGKGGDKDWLSSGKLPGNPLMDGFRGSLFRQNGYDLFAERLVVIFEDGMLILSELGLSAFHRAEQIHGRSHIVECDFSQSRITVCLNP